MTDYLLKLRIINDIGVADTRMQIFQARDDKESEIKALELLKTIISMEIFKLEKIKSKEDTK